VVQDAYLRLHAGVPAAPASAEAWLLTVVKHLAIDRLRRRRFERQEALELLLDDAHRAPSAEQLATRSLDAAVALRRITGALAPHEAAMWLLREVFDADYAEIARSAGRQEASCRQLVRRASRKVREASGARRDEEDALFRLCWQSIRTCDAQMLHALLAPARVTALDPFVLRYRTTRLRYEAVGRIARGPSIPQGERSATAHCTTAQIDGRYAVVLVLDGVVLCALPVGPVNDERPAGALRAP
jgi:RNA polymerase sigma-70 factor (ECF subfamily)